MSLDDKVVLCLVLKLVQWNSFTRMLESMSWCWWLCCVGKDSRLRDFAFEVKGRGTESEMDVMRLD